MMIEEKSEAIEKPSKSIVISSFPMHQARSTIRGRTRSDTCIQRSRVRARHVLILSYRAKNSIEGSLLNSGRITVPMKLLDRPRCVQRV